MPNYTDPFWMVGTGMQLILVVWLLYLFVKLHKYFKVARKLSFEPETAAWAKVTMDPHAPRRPQKALVERVASGLADAEGNKRLNPWVQRGLKVGVIALVVFLLFNVGFFSPFFSDRTPASLTFTARATNKTYIYGTTACGNATVTQATLVTLAGDYAVINFEGELASLNTTYNGPWYEFTIRQSPRCRPGYYELVSAKELEVSGVAPSQG